jgi:hypothetical protein
MKKKNTGAVRASVRNRAHVRWIKGACLSSGSADRQIGRIGTRDGLTTYCLCPEGLRISIRIGTEDGLTTLRLSSD